MKITKLRELSIDELRARGRDLKQEALHLRIQKASGQLENKAILKTLRKENARIETILSERRLDLNAGTKASEGGKTAPVQKESQKKAAPKPVSKKATVKKAPAKKKAE